MWYGHVECHRLFDKSVNRDILIVRHESESFVSRYSPSSRCIGKRNGRPIRRGLLKRQRHPHHFTGLVRHSLAGSGAGISSDPDIPLP